MKDVAVSDLAAAGDDGENRSADLVVGETYTGCGRDSNRELVAEGVSVLVPLGESGSRAR